jgi:hypothetical protein
VKTMKGTTIKGLSIAFLLLAIVPSARPVGLQSTTANTATTPNRNLPKGVTSGSSVPALDLSVSVLAYGCKGDGLTNDSDCVAQAYIATPVNGTLVFSPGRTFMFSELPVRKSMTLDIRGQLRLTGTLDVCSGGVTVTGSTEGPFTNGWDRPTSIVWVGPPSGVIIRAGGGEARDGMFGIHIQNLGLDGARIANVTGLLLGNSASSNPNIGATFSMFENLLIQGTFKAIDIQRGSEQNHLSKIVIGGTPNRLIVPGSIGVCVACVAGSTHVTTNYFDRMTFGGHDNLVVIGGPNHERPVTTVITNSIFNVIDKASSDVKILSAEDTILENNYFESDTSKRTPIVLGDPAFSRSLFHVPLGTIIRQNLFSGGDSTGGPTPFIKAFRFNKRKRVVCPC